jgi:TolB-like protein/DNA-binding winged helix-turn-helix (wHTH) protein/Tfp pilus assembly protein PilF
MKASPVPPRSVRFAEFEVDLRAGELHKFNRKIRLQDQPFQILVMLLERTGDVVTREELREKLWPSDTFVDFDHGLNNAVNRLREALCDSAETPRYIETLPRRGYRFIAPVDFTPVSVTPLPVEHGAASGVLLKSNATEQSAAGAGASLPVPRARFPLPWLYVGIFIGVAALPLALNVGHLREKIAGRPPTSQIQSIAVLPLENLSGDPAQEFFADGMTDAVTTDLAQYSSLRIISRTSAMQYKGTRKSLPQIASELNVDAVVEGSVIRSGNRVRVTAQLIRAQSDRHLWAQTYDGDLSDILTLQSQVAQAIANQVDVKLSGPKATQAKKIPRVNPQAYEAYLKGRFFWSKRTEEGIKRALGYFQEAVRDDPNSALGYVGLADCYILNGGGYLGLGEAQAFPRASAATMKALELDDSLAEAHVSLAAIKVEHDWDWSGGEREFRRALELNPNYATAHQWYSQFLSAMGRHDEAIREGRRAVELDPVSLAANWSLGARLYFARRYDDAIQQLQRAIEIEPGFSESYAWLAFTYDKKGMHDQAVTQRQKALALSGISPNAAATLAQTYRTSGWRAFWLKWIEIYKKGSTESTWDASELAEAYAIAEDREQALAWLEKAYQEHLGEVVYIKEKPVFDSLHSDARFEDLLRRMAFPPQLSPPSSR